MQTNQNPITPSQENRPAAPPAEATLLMSLALDGLLDDEEEAQLRALLKAHPALAAEWERWQQIDTGLRASPSAEPPAGFVSRVELRLLQQERRQRLLWGTVLGVVAGLLWIGLLAGALSLGVFVMFARADWLAEFVHIVAYLSATAAGWWNTIAVSLSATLSSPQARVFTAGYALMATSLLALWLLWLQHSTQPVDRGRSI